MNSSPEQSPTIRRIERRWRILDLIIGTTMIIMGAGLLILVFSDFKWVTTTHTGRILGAPYGIFLGIIALFSGTIMIARAIKGRRRKNFTK